MALLSSTIIALLDTKGLNLGARDVNMGTLVKFHDNSTGAYDASAGSTTFKTGTGAVSLNGDVTVAGKGRFGTHDWGVGATGVLLNGTDDDMVLISAGRINAAVASGAYAASYNQLAVTITQTNNVSVFGSWSELYITGDVSLASNGGAVWGNLEMADAGGAITLPGGIGYHAALVGTVLGSDGVSLTSGGILAGAHLDSNLNASATINGIFAAVSVNTGAGSKNWAHAMYINGADNVFGFGSGTAYEDGVKVTDGAAGDTGSEGTVGFDALARIYIGSTAYYIALFDAASVTGE